eukprot:TRINITY_DN21547_c0_g1_i1.p1 TRINITY_DN21547_c0_g1~~TRINITY_DN21547_c0_g1_i1.p1  ORF type:complete len:525 (-),score=89.00 TRINITY_DN21547_c0_g1_i1:54-1628(-)
MPPVIAPSPTVGTAGDAAVHQSIYPSLYSPGMAAPLQQQQQLLHTYAEQRTLAPQANPVAYNPAPPPKPAAQAVLPQHFYNPQYQQVLQQQQQHVQQQAQCRPPYATPQMPPQYLQPTGNHIPVQQNPQYGQWAAPPQQGYPPVQQPAQYMQQQQAPPMQYAPPPQYQPTAPPMQAAPQYAHQPLAASMYPNNPATPFHLGPLPVVQPPQAPQPAGPASPGPAVGHAPVAVPQAAPPQIAAPVAPPAASQSPPSSKRYTAVQKLGAGGQGSVWLVDLKFKGFQYTTVQNAPVDSTERVALKRVPCQSFEDANMALEEVKFLIKFRHPNIIGYHDFFLEQEGAVFNVCIAMEFCCNGDLGAYCVAHGAPTEADAARWAKEIASALEYLHLQKIIHRDLKPANVFLDEQLVCKVGDLGLLRRVQQIEEQVKTQVGTPMYLAPEVLANKNYDEKVDTWALGCLLYTIMTGIIRNINFEIYANPDICTQLRSDLSNRYSERLVSAVLGLIKPNPEDRPSAASFLKQME